MSHSHSHEGSHTHGDNCNHGHSHSHGDSSSHSHSHSHSEEPSQQLQKLNISKEEKKKMGGNSKSENSHSHGKGCNHSHGHGGHSHGHSHEEEEEEEKERKQIENVRIQYNIFATQNSIQLWPENWEDDAKNVMTNIVSDLFARLDKKPEEKPELGFLATFGMWQLGREVLVELKFIEKLKGEWLNFFFDSKETHAYQLFLTTLSIVSNEEREGVDWIPFLVELFDQLEKKKATFKEGNVTLMAFRLLELATRNPEMSIPIFEQLPTIINYAEELSKKALSDEESLQSTILVTYLIRNLLTHFPPESFQNWFDFLWSKRLVQRQLAVLQDLHQNRWDLLIHSFYFWEALMIPKFADKMELLRIPHLAIEIMNHSCHPPPPQIVEECKGLLQAFFFYLSPAKRFQLQLSVAQARLNVDLDPKNLVGKEQKEFMDANPQSQKQLNSVLSSFCANPTCKNKNPTNKCSACKVTQYCGRECQVADWKRHKLLCNKK